MPSLALSSTFSSSSCLLPLPIYLSCSSILHYDNLSVVSCRSNTFKFPRPSNIAHSHFPRDKLCLGKSAWPRDTAPQSSISLHYEARSRVLHKGTPTTLCLVSPSGNLIIVYGRFFLFLFCFHHFLCFILLLMLVIIIVTEFNLVCHLV